MTEYKSEQQRKRKRALARDELPDNVPEVLTGSDHFRVNTFYFMVDSLSTELGNRAEKYKHLQTVFGFLEELKQLTSSSITEKATELLKVYESDLEESVVQECLHFKSFCWSKMK